MVVGRHVGHRWWSLVGRWWGIGGGRLSEGGGHILSAW